MIDVDLTEEQRLLERSVREWAAREVAPAIHDLDREHRFDRSVLSGMASLGLLGCRTDTPTRCGLPAWVSKRRAVGTGP
jgi:alkylation response protein AidB-like acyl-CoA dehydrogenase